MHELGRGAIAGVLVHELGRVAIAGDLVAVQVEDGEHAAVAGRVQELVAVPAGRERPGLGLAVADDARDYARMELQPGTHPLSYTVRATTPGTFRVAPAKVEEMYTPETFGRSWGVVVTIR